MEEKSKFALGIDMGTTSISITVADMENHRQLMYRSLPHESALPPSEPWRREQDPQRIVKSALNLVEEALAEFPQIQAIGLTGQMHGILYTDDQGNAVSSLVTWQDGRGDLKGADGLSTAERMTAVTGMPVSTGFGLVTHAYNMENGLVPSSARKLCTIMDYVGMQLTGRREPLMHVTNAASLGLFDVEKGAFCRDALKRAKIDEGFLPGVTADVSLLGMFRGIPVFAAVGDNQASFFGSVREEEKAVLVNFGTGSQISMALQEPVGAEGAEIRPYFGGKFLLSGAALCGGRAYALMERFFSQFAQAAGFGGGEQYSVMNRLAAEAYEEKDQLQVQTTFAGTRNNPHLRGMIGNIGENNFTPGQLVLGTMRGMADELHAMYQPFADGQRDMLIASGNAVDRNAVLRRVLSDTFGMTLHMPSVREAAAFGAALLAALSAGMADMTDVKACIFCHADEVMN